MTAGIRRRLAAAAIGLGIGCSVIVGTHHAWTYGWPGDTLNGGVVVDIGVGCLGFEIWGAPGFFGGTPGGIGGACDL